MSEDANKELSGLANRGIALKENKEVSVTVSLEELEKRLSSLTK